MHGVGRIGSFDSKVAKHRRFAGANPINDADPVKSSRAQFTKSNNQM